MDVNERNRRLATGKFDWEDLWPKVLEYENQARIFRFSFGLDELPQEAGVILLRGPRQYGKSTWLEVELKYSAEEFGKGSSYFLNGDHIANVDELEKEIFTLVQSFNPKSRVKRLFIDEICAVPHWEKAIKRLADRGVLKDVLVVTTGSKASDIRRASERLPGRKGKLSRTDFIFTGVSYKDFHSQLHSELGEDTLIAYLLSGGSPIGAKEIWQFSKIPEYVIEITRDWIVGELVKSGRSKTFLLPLLRVIADKACTRMGYLNLARASGLANNTLAAEYVELLSDALAVLPSFHWDAAKEVPLQKKPCKFHFVNLAVAVAFSQEGFRTIDDFKSLPNPKKSKWFEWLVCQELFRRQCIKGTLMPESLFFWANKEHEIDFVDNEGRYYEVKTGKSSPQEFAWFPKLFPNKKLIVISESEFQTKTVKGITFEQFMLADGFCHPYPGEVEDENIYNDYLEF